MLLISALKCPDCLLHYQKKNERNVMSQMKNKIYDFFYQRVRGLVCTLGLTTVLGSQNVAKS